jgi:hypothetical protein
MWTRFLNTLKRKLHLGRELLTSEMRAEIDRLGLDQERFQRTVDNEGLEFGKFCLSHCSKEANLFERWYPRLTEYCIAKRSQSPFPNKDSLDLVDAATFRILEPKIRNCEHVPCRGNFTVAFFTAPLHVLPLVAQLWQSSYRHAVFLTPEELAEWQRIYASEEADQDSWWFIFQDWNAEIKPFPDPCWLKEASFEDAPGLTYVLITCGLSWGLLAGGYKTELWSIDKAGKESFVLDVCIADY